MQAFDHVSASQIDTFGDCRRKWWFQSILGLRPPSSPAAALGSAVHAALERYVLDGTRPDPNDPAGAIALAGLPYAQPAGAAPLLVELDMASHAANTLRLGGVAVHGRIDLVDPGADPLTVQDWKTTSALKWAKTEDQLRVNAQAILYARFILDWSAHEGRAVDRVRFQHVVLTTKGPIVAVKTAVDLDREHIEGEWSRLDATVKTMRDHAIATRPSDVPATKSSCAKYGGCPFRDRCEAIGAWGSTLRDPRHTHSQVTSQEAPMTTNNPAVDALAALRARKGAQGASTPPTHPTPPPRAPDAPEGQRSATVEPSAARPAEPSAARGAGGAIVPPDAPADDWATEGKPDGPGWGGEARALFQERAAIREYDGKTPRGLAERGAERDARSIAAERTTAPPVAPVAPAAYAETPAPPLSSGSSVLSAPPGVAAPSSSVVDAPPAHPPLTSTGQPAVLSTSRTPLVLYIDCYPQRGVVGGITHLEDVVAPLQKQIAARAGVPIYSLIEYGKGPAQIAAALLENPPQGAVYVNSRLPASAAALEVLMPLAIGIVKGHH